MATWLKQVGYTTSFIGKYMNGYEAISPYIPPGWDDWRVFSNSIQPLLIDPATPWRAGFVIEH